jgi:hypothetical protein
MRHDEPRELRNASTKGNEGGASETPPVGNPGRGLVLTNESPLGSSTAMSSARNTIETVFASDETILLQSDLSVPRRVGIDHAAPMAAIRAQPDGLFLSPQLDTDAAYGRQATADDRGARRRSTSGGRNCWRSSAVLVATIPKPEFGWIPANLCDLSKG